MFLQRELLSRYSRTIPTMSAGSDFTSLTLTLGGSMLTRRRIFVGGVATVICAPAIVASGSRHRHWPHDQAAIGRARKGRDAALDLAGPSLLTKAPADRA